MRVLYQFPLSHYCEKARWLLDHKELDYIANNLIPGFHRAFTYLKSSQYLLPMLRDDKFWVADSTQIALHLDANYPEHALLRREPDLRQQALEIDKLAGKLGVHVRRWSLAQSLSVGDHSLEIMMGEQGYLRQFEKYSKPFMKALLSKSYQLDVEKVAESKQQIDTIVEQLNQRLIDNHGRYFVGERLGLADISVCSMLAPLLDIAGTPWEKEHTEILSKEFKDYKERLTQLPIGQYVLRVYQTERNARVDWRGI